MREKIEILSGNPITDIGEFKISDIIELESDYEELQNKLNIAVEALELCRDFPLRGRSNASVIIPTLREPL